MLSCIVFSYTAVSPNLSESSSEHLQDLEPHQEQNWCLRNICGTNKSVIHKLIEYFLNLIIHINSQEGKEQKKEIQLDGSKKEVRKIAKWAKRVESQTG